jgi:hypothetical protein
MKHRLGPALAFFLLWILAASLPGQGDSNPFDLEHRIGEDAGTIVAPPPATSGNPFDKLAGTATATAPSKAVKPRPTLNRPLSETGQKTWVLVMNLVTLLITTLVLTFLRSTYQKTRRALFSDTMLNQLYREREAGQLGLFIIGYVVFFINASLFIWLAARYFGWLETNYPWRVYGLLLLLIAGVFLGKHLLLAILGSVFPIQKVLKQYSFTIMIFAIAIGLLLAPANLLMAYTPDNGKRAVFFIAIALGGLLYAIRSLRGLFMANRYLSSHPFHFLLYICAVEIAPTLLLYKLITADVTGWT